MPTNPHDAIVIILDIGKSVSSLNEYETNTFFEHSKKCVSWIIQRKLISQSVDVLSIILIGSDDVNNSWKLSGYNNINCKFEFQNASWDMLKFIELEIKPTENDSDWLGALIMSMEMLKAYEEFNHVANKKIVFFSDFVYPLSDDIDDALIKNIKKLNICVTIIGPENILSLIENDNNDEPATKKRKNDVVMISQERQNGEEIILQFWKKLPEQVIICSFESALKQLCSFTRKSCRKTPWNSILDIGDAKISISMYKKTDPKSSKKFDKKYLKSNENETQNVEPSQNPQMSQTIPVIRDKIMNYKHESKLNKELIDVEVTPDETIEAYRYGTTVIPFSREDKTIMEYKPGPKSFSIIGFTNISSVPYYLLSGECSYVVLGREKDVNAEIALSAIIQAMKQMECVGIVRKVYSYNRGLSLGILYPFVEEIYSDDSDDVFCKECLLFVELAFQEEIKSIDFPSLENFMKNITKDQNDAIDDLIDSMDLMNAEKGLRGEPCEAFDLSNLHDFKEQFFHYCVVQKGLHPEKPLPKTVPDYIKNYIKMPKSVEDKMKVPMNKIKENFKITKIERVENFNRKINSESENSKEKGNDDNDNASDSFVISPDDENVRHFTSDDVKKEKNSVKRKIMSLFAKSLPKDDELNELFMENSKGNQSDLSKIFQNVYLSVREQYLNKNPDYFNWWVPKFKNYAFVSGGIAGNIWEDLASENLGLISEDENVYSNITEGQAEDFLHSTATISLKCDDSQTVDKPEYATSQSDIEEDFEKEIFISSP